MAQSYAQIQKQIESLQRQAQAIRQSETKGVIERIQVAIEHYGLTPEQLFGTGPKLKSSTKSSVKSAGNGAKYADGKGNVWSGRGPRPRWLREVLDAGASIESFRSADLLSSVSDSSASLRTRSDKPKAKRAVSKVVYGDDAGNTWTGRGPKPRWLKDALAAGKEMAELKK